MKILLISGDHKRHKILHLLLTQNLSLYLGLLKREKIVFQKFIGSRIKLIKLTLIITLKKEMNMKKYFKYNEKKN